MVQVITGGEEVFDALLYGKKHPSTSAFLRQQVENVSDRLTDASRSFFSHARDVYERISGSEAARRARAASRSLKSIWNTDDVHAMTEVHQMQHAKPVMQRWIMAQTDIRRLFQKQRCDGYEGSYVDVFPGDIGENHYDWRRVNNGFVHFVTDEDGNETDDWYASTYMDDLLPDDEELTLEEQVDIHDTWSNVVAQIRAGGSDPTSKWDSEL